MHIERKGFTGGALGAFVFTLLVKVALPIETGRLRYAGAPAEA